MDLNVFDMLQSINKTITNAQQNKLLTVKAGTTPGTALTQLAQAKLLSAPVVDDRNMMTGVFDVVSVAQKIGGSVEKGKEFNTSTVNTLLNTGSVEEFLGFQTGSIKDGFDTAIEPADEILSFSVARLIESVFCRNDTDVAQDSVHRVVLIDANGAPAGVLSETDIVNFIFKHPRVLSLKMWGTLEDIGFMKGGTFPSASATEPVWSVMKMLAEGGKGDEAIAILDDRGMLLGSFSENDLRGLTAERLSLMNGSIGEFLKSIHMPPLPITTVSPKDTLGHLIRLLVEQRVRCAWIVNADNRPIGCVTATDVCLAAYLLGTNESETKKRTKLQDFTQFELHPQATPFYPHNQIHLMQTRLRDVISALKKDQQADNICFCLPNSSLEDALQVMNKNHVLSLPVEDINHKLIGFVDLDAILKRLVRFVEEENGGGALTQKQIQKFCGLPLTEVSTSDYEVVWPASLDNKVYDILLPFAVNGSRHGIHRLLVLNPAGTPITILTQSDVIKYAIMQTDVIGDKAHLTISQLGIVTPNPLLLHENSPVWSGFVQMVRAGVHCLPVVNGKGELIDILSSSDLRCVKPSQLGDVLSYPTRAFKEAVYGFVGNSGTTPVTATLETSFTFVLNELADSGVHRIVIVDGHNKPVGIVALSDVLRCLVTK